MVGSIPKAIQRPRKSALLAEFFGIMLGDGGMSEYQATVTLHSIDDFEYSTFIIKTIEKLFKYTPSIIFRKNTPVLVLCMSRIQLVQFLHVLGLPIGNKINQNIDIPHWIKHRKDFAISCVRGLIDTDGSVFSHHYLSKARSYSYKKLSFTSASPLLLESVAHILKELGMKPRFGSNKDVRLDSIKDMKRYFSMVGTHNPKHLRRYLS